MKQYRYYTVEDLSLDQDFIDWVRKGSNDDAWQQFLKDHPGNTSQILEARRIVESFEPVPVSIGNDEMEAEIAALMAVTAEPNPVADEPNPVTDDKKGSGMKRLLITVMSVAAAALIWLFGLRDTMVRDTERTYHNLVAEKDLVEHVNTTNEVITFFLPDSSRVKLSPHSRFSYAAGFREPGGREVYLYGEADFEVTKDPQKPFRVYTNELVTKVVGTGFTIRSFDAEEDINITVRTGKVNVSRRNIEGVSLTANQQAIYHKKQRNIVKQLKERPVIISPLLSSRQMIFEEQSVVSVMELLKDAYGISLHYDKALLRGCSITADLTEDVSIYRKLDLICRAINAEYEVIDSEVYIYPNGCK